MYFRRTLTFPAPTLIRSPPEPDVQEKQTTERRRLVSFDRAKDEVYENTSWSKKSCKGRWYSKKQIKQFKDDFFWSARENRESTHPSEVAYKNVMLAVYDECCHATTDEATLSTLCEYSLRTFVGKSNHRCGMEKMSVKEMEYDKRRRRADLTQGVLDAQATYTAGCVAARMQLVRRASEGLTRPARLFARHTAMALATSLQQQ